MIEDKNIERCLSWLNDKLSLTPQEKHALYMISLGKGRVKKSLLDTKQRQYILDNYKTSTIEMMAFEMKLQPKAVIEFLNHCGITNYRKAYQKLSENEKGYILKYYSTKTVCQLADDLDMLDRKSVIRAFLTKNGLRAKSVDRKKNGK